jgi:subfamily B ATP-binding cassette protein MsbA
MKITPLYRRLLVYLRPYWWPHFALAIVCMWVFSGTNGVMPFLIQHIFDDIFTNKNLTALKLLPGIIIATFLVRGVVGFGSTYLTEYVGQRIVADLRAALNDHIQHMSLSCARR